MTKPTIGLYGIHDSYPDGKIAHAHDHSIVIMENGKVESYLQLERKTRIKHDNSMHHHILTLIKEKGLAVADYDLVWTDNIIGRSFISSDGKIRLEANILNHLTNGLETGRFWNIDKVSDAFVLNHELAHIYSHLPFCGTFEENSLLIQYDGGASQGNFSAWKWTNGELSLLENHWRLKQFSSIYNANALVFKLMKASFNTQHGVPGKFMGFASYGTESSQLKEWLLNNNMFDHIWKSPAIFFASIKSKFNLDINTFDLHHTFLQDVAATLQHIWIDSLLQELGRLQNISKCRTLYYSGGSALNILGNNAILSSNLFDSVFIPPCTEDSGLALGAAAALELKKHGTVQIHTPYLNNWGIEEYAVQLNADTIKKVASLVKDGKVIGICNGPGEIGPRALGNRSIIARADSKLLAEKISVKMKQREWFRPVAPLMLATQFTYFTGTRPHLLNKYMLLENVILKERINEIQGAVHINGTARIQIIKDEDENPFIFQLLSVLNDEFNIRSVINTSFNIKGEPIVHKTVDAKISAKKMGLDYLVLNGILEKIS